MPAFKDLTGQTFGRWTVMRYAGHGACKKTQWECQCACGTVGLALAGNLCKGASQSCGCLHKEQLAAMRTTHGLSKGRIVTQEHKIWMGMRKRCRNSHAVNYPNYGGRGITIDPRWENFATFLADMGERPSAEHSVERRDNNGPYSPENCYWATRQQQRRNARNLLLLTFQGKTQCLKDWAKEYGIKYGTLYQRIQSGLPVEYALQKR